MRPLIAMSSRFTATADTWLVPATALGRTYQDAIIRAGGIPLAVPPMIVDDELDLAARAVLSSVDGLCLPGGPDVEPARYGAPTAHTQLKAVRREHDGLDLALVRAALDLGKPVLAICRGHQVLNVALGGTLHQHLPDVIGDDRGAGHFRQHNEIELVAGSKAAAAMGTTRPQGHCVHHQAIDRLGDGLVVSGVAEGLVECVELPDRWVVGVQWHPEDDAADDPQQQALFDGFVAATRQLAPTP